VRRAFHHFPGPKTSPKWGVPKKGLSLEGQVPSGFIFVLYLWLAAIERFIVEFYRADHDLLWGQLSLAQYVALGVFVAGLVLMRVFKK